MTNIDRSHYEQDGLWGAENVELPDHQVQRFDAIDALLPNDATRILDVGAGDGRVLHHLLQRRSASTVAIAVERSLSALRHAVGTTQIQGSIDAVPVPDRSVDAVLCCEVLEHLPEPTYRVGLRELTRIADRYIIITVPNREVRRRSDVTCPECGCRYSRARHLRSFSPDQLDGLFNGFALEAVSECGPRQPVYPRIMRVGLERLGLLPVLGSPSCPQCGAGYRPSPSRPTVTGDIGSMTNKAPDAVDESGGGAGAPDRYRMLRKLVPKQRHPYWLCARFGRSDLSR